MKDTIGAHMDAARIDTRRAEFWIEAELRAANPRYAGLRRAKHEGAAAGHAFRAAELAYDMGQAHGFLTAANAAYEAIGMPNRFVL